MENKFIAFVVLMLLGGSLCAQTKSIPNKVETKRLIQEVLDAGYDSEECDSTDLTCFIINNNNKRVYEELKQPNVHIVRMYSPILRDSIDSYKFFECFDKYFSIDENNYIMYFFKWDKGKNVIFGMAQSKVDSLNSISYTPVISTSTAIKSTFLNLPEIGNSNLIFSMSFGVTLFVDDNRIKVIVNDEVVDGYSFFSKYDLVEINKRFKGMLKNTPVN